MGEDIRHYLEGAQRKPIKGLRKILKEGLEVDSGNKYKADRVSHSGKTCQVVQGRTQSRNNCCTAEQIPGKKLR